jgi:hypothetical protein
VWAGLSACSSSSQPSGPTETAPGASDASAVIDATGPALTGDGGGRDAAAPTDASPADAAQATPGDAAADGGAGDASDTDITGSNECAAFCAKVKGACGTCDPANDCAIPAGSCAQAEKAYLQCEATAGQFSCGSSGWAVVSSCQRDVSVCPPPPVCSRTPPDTACASCLQVQCKSYLDVFVSEVDYPDFNDCVTQCETACNDPNSCIYGGQFPACGSSGPNSWQDVIGLQECGLRACSSVCTVSTVIF